MRYLLVAAAAAIAAGGVVALRSPGTVVRERRVEVPLRVEVPIDVPTSRPDVEKRTPAEETTAKTNERRTEAGSSVPLASQEKMLFLFERELALTVDQRRHFVEVLRERALEIEEINRRIADSRIFSRSEYSRTIRGIRARSYERMAEVLDSVQNRRFRQLVAEGRLGDAVAIAIDSSWTVVD